MKFLLIVIVFAVVIAIFRSKTTRRERDAPRPPRTGPAPQAMMLSCAQCGLHLPRDDALPGRGGVFCSAAHRTAYEQAHPGA